MGSPRWRPAGVWGRVAAEACVGVLNVLDALPGDPRSARDGFRRLDNVGEASEVGLQRGHINGSLPRPSGRQGELARELAGDLEREWLGFVAVQVDDDAVAGVRAERQAAEGGAVSVIEDEEPGGGLAVAHRLLQFRHRGAHAYPGPRLALHDDPHVRAAGRVGVERGDVVTALVPVRSVFGSNVLNGVAERRERRGERLADDVLVVGSLRGSALVLGIEQLRCALALARGALGGRELLPQRHDLWQKITH